MTMEQARRASATFEDVYTPMGDAVVIAHCCMQGGNPSAYVTGAHYTGHYDIIDLTAKEDLRPTVYP